MTLRFSVSDKYNQKDDDLNKIKAEMYSSRMSTMAIMDFEGLGSEFYEQEEEVERDEPIDPIWEAQQISTFTAWCNAHLRKADVKIECFEQDFRSGLKLMKLLEIISGEKLPLPDKGRMRFHKIANVNKALKYVQSKSVKLASIGAEEIVDGNVKMTLGMIWTIILRFTIQDIYVEDSSAKDGLLLWCKRKTNGYKHINITNFKNSFQNGLAFCALIHSHDSTLFNYDSLSPKNARQNLELAFSVAAKHFDVPQMLNVEDMVSNQESDEKSIMTYVASYYHAFNKRDKMSSAISNICSIISEKIKEEHNSEDPEVLVMSLLTWIESYINQFQNQPRLKNRQELVKRNGLFHEQYGKAEKPSKLGEKLLYNYYCLLTCSHSNSASPRYYHDKLELVKEKWNELEKWEEKYQMYLLTQTKRMDKIQNLLDKFETCYQAHKLWLDDQMDKLMGKEYEHASLYELRCLKREQETFLLAVGSKQSVSEKIINISKELRSIGYHDSDTIESRTATLIQIWDSIGQLHKHRLDHINKYYSALTDIDELQLEFAQRVTPLFNWVKQSNIDLIDSFILHCVEEIKELVDAHEEFKMTLRDAHSEFESVQSISHRISGIVSNSSIEKVPLNPYTAVKLHDLEKEWSCLEGNIRKREKVLKDSLSKQQKGRDFLEKYQSQSIQIIQQLEIVQQDLFELIGHSNSRNSSSGVRTQKSRDNEKLLRQLKVMKTELSNVERRLPNLEKEYRLCREQENNGLSDSYEDRLITSQELSAIQKTLSDLVGRVDKWISAALSISSTNRVGGNLDTSLLATMTTHDYRDTFEFFDKARAGKIDSNAFHACLLSLGFDLEQDKENDKYFSEIMRQVDPLNSGFVSMNSFLYFMDKHQSSCHGDSVNGTHSTSNKHTTTSNHSNDIKKDQDQELQQAFSVIAQDNQFVTESLLRAKLPETIVEYCISRMKPKSDSSRHNHHLETTTIYDFTSL